MNNGGSSQKDLTLAQFSKNGCKITTPRIFSLGADSAQGRDLAPIFVKLSQSEKLSEIKLPFLTMIDSFNSLF